MLERLQGDVHPLVVDDWSFATIYNGSRVRLSHNSVRACTCKKHHPRAF